MKYERHTNKSYSQSVKDKESVAYMRLALLEDAIEAKKLVYTEALLDGIKERRYDLEFKNASKDAIEALSWVIKYIQTF